MRLFEWHSIGHLTSRILVRKGVPTKIIQEILGHEIISTTEKYLGALGVDKKHLQVLSNKKVRQTVRLTDKRKTGKMKLIQNQRVYWRPQGDSNPCCRRERSIYTGFFPILTPFDRL